MYLHTFPVILNLFILRTKESLALRNNCRYKLPRATTVTGRPPGFETATRIAEVSLLSVRNSLAPCDAQFLPGLFLIHRAGQQSARSIQRQHGVDI